jgi:hypothetical protein
MHPPGTRGLESGPVRQASPQFHERTGDLVANGCLALVVVHRRRSRVAVTVTVASSARRLCGGSGCCDRSGVSAGSAFRAHDACLQRRTGAGACCAGGGVCGVGFAHDRHFWVIVVG